MAIIIDVIILAIILLCTFIGYKKGLIKVAFSLFSFIIALIVAFILSKPVANYVIQHTEIDNNIENSISSSLSINDDSTSDEEIDSERKIDLEKEFNISIPDILLPNVQQTVENISITVTEKLIQLAALLLIFIIVRIIMHFITSLADSIAKLPILKQFNELGGLIYGILQGFLIVYIILAVISFVAPIFNLTFVNDINNSIVGSKLYNHNIILSMLF